MPVPKPEARENQSEYIVRCMEWASENESDKPQEQQLAMCYQAYRMGRGTGIKKAELMEELAFEKDRLYKMLQTIEDGGSEHLEGSTDNMTSEGESHR